MVALIVGLALLFYCWLVMFCVRAYAASRHPEEGDGYPEPVPPRPVPYGGSLEHLSGKRKQLARTTQRRRAQFREKVEERLRLQAARAARAARRVS